MDSSGKVQRQRQDTHSFLCPVLVPLSLIRPAMLFPLKKCVLSMFSAPPSIVACVSGPAIVTSAASLCCLQCLSVTHSVTPLLLLLVFSWPLLVPIPFHFITHPHQLPHSLVWCPQSWLSNTALHPWCDSCYFMCLSLCFQECWHFQKQNWCTSSAEYTVTFLFFNYHIIWISLI